MCHVVIGFGHNFSSLTNSLQALLFEYLLSHPMIILLDVAVLLRMSEIIIKLALKKNICRYLKVGPCEITDF